MAKEKGQIDNALIYEVLKDVQAKASSTDKHVKELDRRFDAVERSLNSLRMDIAALSDLGVDQRGSVRSLAERVERIEHRLGLIDELHT